MSATIRRNFKSCGMAVQNGIRCWFIVFVTYKTELLNLIWYRILPFAPNAWQLYFSPRNSNKKPFTENFNFWLCRITIYHNFLFLFRGNLLNILVISAKFISHLQVRNLAQVSEFYPCNRRRDVPLSPLMTSKLPLIVPKIC